MTAELSVSTENLDERDFRAIMGQSQIRSRPPIARNKHPGDLRFDFHASLTVSSAITAIIVRALPPLALVCPSDRQQ